VLYAIGTGWGAVPYANPADTGKVSLRWSSDAANFYSRAGGHKQGDTRQAASVICAHAHPGQHATMWSRGAARAYFEVDLRDVTLRPTHFAYRNDYGGGGNHPRDFELQGSNDGKQWTTLSKHSREAWNGIGAKSWPVKARPDGYFRIFRVQNLSHPNHLCCAGLELYGHVRGAPAMTATPVIAALAGSGESSIPIVLGSETTAPKGSGAADGSLPLVEIVGNLKRELGVKGTNMVETVDAAVEALGIQAKVRGLSLIEKARKCWQVVGGAPSA